MSVRGFNVGTGVERYDYNALDNIPLTTNTRVKGDAESEYRDGDVNLTKANIGLGNVDNTSDANKPVSTAQQNALNGKVDKVTGKGLSTNDYTDAEKQKVADMQSDLDDLSRHLEDVKQRNSTNLLLDFGNFYDKSSGSLRWVWDSAHTTCTYSLAGTYDGTVQVLYNNTEELPDQLIPGNTYQIEFLTTMPHNIVLRVEFYADGSFIESYMVYEDKAVTIPANCTGLRIQTNFPPIPFNGKMTVAIVNAPSNAELNIKLGDLSQQISDVEDAVNDETTGLGTKAPVILETASGDIASFSDGADNMPIKSLVANIEPVQDLHGYDSPWPAGGGKNLLDYDTVYASLKTAENSFSGRCDALFQIKWYIPESLVGSKLRFSFNVDTISTGTVTPRAVVDGANISGEALSSGTGYVIATPTSTDDLFTIAFRTGTATITISNLMVEVITDETADIVWAPYSNLCPISGWTGLTASHSGADTSDPDTISVNWQSTAGEVYGGTLDVVSGKMRVNFRCWVMNGTGAASSGLSFAKGGNTSRHEYYTLATSSTPLISASANRNDVICSHFETADSGDFYANVRSGQFRINVPLTDERNTAELMNAWVAEQYNAGTPLQYCARLASPIEYELTPQEVSTLLGTNHVWTNVGPVEVTYPADTKLFIEELTQPTEDDMTADHAIASGTFFMIGNTLYLATAQIAAGATITPGTNATKLSLADALNQLNT